MAKQYKTGLIITGDASGGIRAIKATDNELGKLNQGFDRGSRRSKQFNQDVNDTSRGLEILKTSAGGVAAAMATAFGAGSIINQARIIADTDSLAKSIGMSTSELQAWDYAAKQAGLAGGKMGDILKDITERIGEFTAEGTGEAAALFENLNLNINEMKRLAPDQQLLRIADAISTLETRGEKISYLERLGSDATLLLPLLDNNAEQLREFTSEAQALGVAMSQMDIESAIEANRAMSQLTGTMEGFTNQVVADLGPGLATAVGGLTDLIQEAGGAARILNEIKDVATLTGAVMAGRYVNSLIESTKRMIEKNAASAAAAAADERTMQMTMRRSAAEATSAKRLLGRAVAEAQATKGTDAHAAALARLRVARERSIAATANHTVAVNANATATQRATVAARAASGAYALIGGPLGVATLAATAFFMFRDSSDEVVTSLNELKQPLDDVIERFETMNADLREGEILKWSEAVRSETDEVRQAIQELQSDVLQATVSQQDRAERPAFVESLLAGFKDVESGAKTFDEVLQQVLAQADVQPYVIESWRAQAAEISEGVLAVQDGNSVLQTLRNLQDSAAQGAENLGNSIRGNAPSEKTLQAWGTYNDRLRESIAASRDGGSALGAANRAMDGMGEGVNSVMRGYTAFLTVQDEVLKDQKKAQEESAAAAKQSASESARAYEQAARAAEQSAKQQADALRSIQHEMNPLTAEHDKYVERLGVLEQALSDNTLTKEEYGEALRWNAEQYQRAATGADDYDKQTESLISTYDRHNQRAAELQNALRDMGERYRAGVITGEQYVRMVAGVREEMRQLAEEADPLSKDLARSWEEAGNRIDQTFSDGFTGALDSFSDFEKQLLSGFKRLMGELLYQASLRPIVVGFTTDMRGAMSGGGIDFGNTIGAARGLMNGSSMFSGGVAAAGAGGLYANAVTAGAGTLYGSAATGAAIGPAANAGIMSSISSGVSAAMPWIGAGLLADNVLGLGITDGITKAISGLFGSSPTKFSGRFGTTGTADPSQYAGSGKDGVFEHQDSGANFYGQSALGYTGFLDRGTERLQRAGQGEGKGWAEELTAASVEMDNLVASVARSPEELELMRAAVQGLETSSRSAADIVDFALNQRPRAALEALGGDFGVFVRSLEGGIESVVQQAQVGQQAHALLSDSMARLGLQFDATGAEAYEAASYMAQQAGGVENLAALHNQFFEGYFSQAERAAFLQEDLTESLAAMGLELPENEAGFRALVEAQNQNTEAGGRNYVQLLQLSSGFSQLQDMLGDTSTAADGAADSLKNAADAQRERDSIESEWLRMIGDTAELRRRELAQLDPSNRAMQQRNWLFEDEQKWLSEIEQRQQQRISGIKQEADAMARARGELASYSNTIGNWLAQHDATEKGMGTPRERLEASDADFWAQYEKALQGDRSAQQGITQFADRYIDNLQEMYASSDPGVNGVNEIRDAMERLPEMLTPEQFLADELRGALEDQTRTLTDVLDLNGDGTVSAIERAISAEWGSTQQLNNVLHQEMTQLGATVLTEAEVRAALGPHATDAEISRLIARVDVNGDGMITRQELTNARIDSLGGGIATSIAPLFKEIDIDGSGWIDYGEFSKTFDGMATDSTLNEIFGILDTNGDGQLSYLEAIAASNSTLVELWASQQNGDVQSAVSEISKMYEQALGRAPDLPGIQYWIDEFLAGASLKTISDSINQHVGRDPGANTGGGSTGGSTGGGSAAQPGRTPRPFWERVASASMSATNREWMQHFQESNRVLEAQRLIRDAGISIPAYASGAWDLQSDHLAQVHKNEFIAPAAGGIADEFRAYAAGDYQAELLAKMDSLQLPSGPMQLPMPEMPPLPQFPQLGSADVLQVLNDVKRELQDSRKETQKAHEEKARLLELIADLMESHSQRSEQLGADQLDELETISRASKTEKHTP